MRDRLAVLTVAALIGTLLLGPLAQSVAAQSQAQTPGLTLPVVSGSLARGGQFSGSLTITRLTNRAGQLVADGMIVGTVASENSLTSTQTPTGASTPASGGSIFASTSTTVPISEPYSVTATPTATATSAATMAATATPTATFDVGAVSISTATPGEDLPRLGLPSQSAYQATSPAAVSQSFREIPLTLADPDMGACDSLHLDLGAVFVDQLGVQLDLAPAIIDLATMPRANRPLGGLLCTVASLLDLGPGSTQAAMLNELLPVVNRALSTASR